MRIACLGGGPAGLYVAIAMKRRPAEGMPSAFEYRDDICMQMASACASPDEAFLAKQPPRFSGD